MSSQGMIGEMKFAEFCYRYEMKVSKPLSDDSPYDFIVDNKNYLYRVQVKTLFINESISIEDNIERFRITFNDKIERYSQTCDVIALYIEPTDTWYLIPANMINSKRIRFYPNKIKGNYEVFKENWGIFNVKTVNNETI